MDSAGELAQWLPPACRVVFILLLSGYAIVGGAVTALWKKLNHKDRVLEEIYREARFLQSQIGGPK